MRNCEQGSQGTDGRMGGMQACRQRECRRGASRRSAARRPLDRAPTAAAPASALTHAQPLDPPNPYWNVAHVEAAWQWDTEEAERAGGSVGASGEGGDPSAGQAASSARPRRAHPWHLASPWHPSSRGAQRSARTDEHEGEHDDGRDGLRRLGHLRVGAGSGGGGARRGSGAGGGPNRPVRSNWSSQPPPAGSTLRQQELPR